MINKALNRVYGGWKNTNPGRSVRDFYQEIYGEISERPTNFPQPKIFATELYVNNTIQTAISNINPDLSDYATKSYVDDAIVVSVPDLSDYATSDNSILNNPTLNNATFSGPISGLSISKNAIGLSNVDNTSDDNKPISVATQNALDTKPNIYEINLSDYEIDVNGILNINLSRNSINNIFNDNSNTDNYTFTGINNGVNELCKCIAHDSKNNLYIGGTFTVAGPVFLHSQTRFVSRICMWDGLKWNRLGGPGGGGVNNTCNAMIFDTNDNLYVGGAFTASNGDNFIITNRVSMWNGTMWNSLGNGSNNGLNGECFCLEFYNGILYAGGIFTQAGTVNASNIARWNGTEWSNLGSGLNGICYSIKVDSNGNLYAGGVFTMAGGVECFNIARWYNEEWHSMNSLFLNQSWFYILTIAINSENHVYIGGSFLENQDGKRFTNIAMWDGNDWYPLANGPGAMVRTIMIDNNNGILYASNGNFFSTWDGNSWIRPHQSDGEIWTMIINSIGDIYIGGSFQRIDEDPLFRRIVKYIKYINLSIDEKEFGSINRNDYITVFKDNNDKIKHSEIVSQKFMFL